MDFDVEPDVDDMGMMTCEVTKRPQNSHKRRRVKADGPADYPSTLNWAQDQMASFHENNLCEPVRRLLKRHIIMTTHYSGHGTPEHAMHLSHRTR